MQSKNGLSKHTAKTGISDNTEFAKILSISAKKTVLSSYKVNNEFIFNFKEELFFKIIYEHHIFNIINYVVYDKDYKVVEHKYKEAFKSFGRLLQFESNLISKECKDDFLLLFSKYRKKFLYYLDCDTMDQDEFFNNMSLHRSYMSIDKRNKTTETMFIRFCVSSKYNLMVLRDFFDQLKRFPDKADFEEYCDERIYIIELYRILLQALTEF